jgi:two-component system chemotaxis response regulator CheB
MAAPNDIAVVAVGGSAGALDVLGEILAKLPARGAAPVVVVVHVPPDRPSHLPSVLAARCPAPVREPEDKEPVAAGTVYVAPPGYHRLIERERTFALSVDDAVLFSRPAIDVLFQSVAEAYGARAVGVVLTGASEDGARGLRAIEDAGGACIVQRPESALVPTMPAAAIAATRAPRVLRVSEIASWLGGLADRPAGEWS